MANSGKQVALITGSGTKRIGYAIAKAAKERGYGLALHYNASEKGAEETVRELSNAGSEVRAFQADVTKESQVERLVEKTIDAFGRIDLLVTCASVWSPKRLEEVTAEHVRQNFDVNTLGTYLCCQKVGLVMAGQASGGVIVSIGDSATERPQADYSSYFTSKGAIPALTRSFAVELAARNPNVRVNCILPGAVLPPESISAKRKSGVIEETLVKRLGHPDNIAQAVFFFVDNDFVTGACLPVDGGAGISRGFKST